MLDGFQPDKFRSKPYCALNSLGGAPDAIIKYAKTYTGAWFSHFVWTNRAQILVNWEGRHPKAHSPVSYPGKDSSYLESWPHSIEQIDRDQDFVEIGKGLDEVIAMMTTTWNGVSRRACMARISSSGLMGSQLKRRLVILA